MFLVFESLGFIFVFNGIGFLGLSCPDRLVVLQNSIVLFGGGLTMRAAKFIPKGEVLTIVIIEVQVMDGVVSGGVDNVRVREEVTCVKRQSS